MNEERALGVNDPIFGDPLEVEEDANYGILVGGMASIDEERMAMAYRTAGDMLVAQALRSGDRSWEVTAPILFVYRHMIELCLKRVVRPQKRSHGLAELIAEANAIAQTTIGQGFPEWAKSRLLEFAEIDKSSTTFRYADGEFPFQPGELWVDLNHLRHVMGILADGLGKLAHRRQARE